MAVSELRYRDAAKRRAWLYKNRRLYKLSKYRAGVAPDEVRGIRCGGPKKQVANKRPGTFLGDRRTAMPASVIPRCWLQLVEF